jgi:mono/diheme cytochrome c family protein
MRKLRCINPERLLPGWIVAIIASALLVIAFQTNAAAQTKKEAPSAGATQRGKYIVDHLAMCIQCHTPRNDAGDLIETQYLQGAPVPVKAPPYPNINWALKAPAIAGLIGYTRDEGVRLLMQGLTREGRVPNPPMPPFRMTRTDAEAVVDYLKSLQ